jgi:hypothetical protein
VGVVVVGGGGGVRGRVAYPMQYATTKRHNKPHLTSALKADDSHRKGPECQLTITVAVSLFMENGAFTSS